MSNNITVAQQGNRLVVDSRLIALELGVPHESLVRNIRRHKVVIESNFEHLGLQVADVEVGNGAIRSDFLHYWLTEDQATFLMTLSRNTPQVIACKVNLVKAFSFAKRNQQQPEQPKLKSAFDLTLEQLYVMSGKWFVPTKQHKALLFGCEEDFITKKRYQEIKASIDPAFDYLSEDAMKNLIAILEYPIKVAAHEKELEEARKEYQDKLDNPDDKFVYYVKTVLGASATEAEIMAAMLDRYEGKVNQEIEELHCQAFENERLLQATAEFESRFKQLQLAIIAKQQQLGGE